MLAGIYAFIDCTNFISICWGANTAPGDSSALLIDCCKAILRDGVEPICVFDGLHRSQTFRHKLHPGYKKKRLIEPPNEARRVELERAMGGLRQATFHVAMAAPEFEADDVIATLCHKVTVPVTVISSDKDFRQLLCPRIKLVTRATRKNWKWQFQEYSETDLFAKHGLTPQQWLDYLALAGDSVDGWPGLPGYGDKKVKALLSQYGTAKQAREQNAKELADFDLKHAYDIVCLRTDAEYTYLD